MTCREKLKLEHPELVDAQYDGGCKGCPYEYGYIDTGCSTASLHMSCTECWDREIPGTEITKKETAIMPTHDIHANTKMTKAQLVEEINNAHKYIQDMEKKLENLQKYQQYEEVADEIKAIHTALMNSGFTNEQAFDLLKTTMQSMMPTILRGMRV